MIDEGKTAADIKEEYEAVVKITVLAKSAEDAQENIEELMEANVADGLITEFEFVADTDDIEDVKRDA